ncbi:hypothetical protein GBAR_LOCUS5929 [Geodia barretti]|uniref:Uncharacterized protein n=1 Tax=Geodia barretti TaxID=519541 RepID=A0AA35W959_GEOBA|nr:hypothetical protein GBAR_LOCUS5929 [Geodia barretti]
MNEVGTSTATSEAGPSSVSSKRRVKERGIFWPKRKKKDECNKIFAYSIDNWDTVDRVEVGGKRFDFMERKATSYDLSLAHHQFDIVCPGTTLTLQCSPAVQSDLEVFRRSKLVCDEVGLLPELPDKSVYSITPRKSPERPAGSDSGDEGPPDFEIHPCFEKESLAQLQYNFDDLRDAYSVIRTHGTYNAPGKAFIVQLGEFLKLSTSNPDRYRCRQSTSVGPNQPGAFHVMWAVPSQRRTISSSTEPESSGEHPVVRQEHVHERYADCVLYDIHTGINPVVVEIKSDINRASRNQNLEQMVGLWGPRQQAMLGLELAEGRVKTKVLIRDDNKNAMIMVHLNDLHVESPRKVRELAKLWVAFTTFVQCHMPSSPSLSD